MLMQPSYGLHTSQGLGGVIWQNPRKINPELWQSADNLYSDILQGAAVISYQAFKAGE